MVIDPELTGAAARVARWDFTAAEAASHYQQTALAKGFRFQLLWPNKPPEHERVRLYVRFTTPDGRKFEAEHALHLGAHGQLQELVATDDPAMGAIGRSAGGSVRSHHGPAARHANGGPLSDGSSHAGHSRPQALTAVRFGHPSGSRIRKNAGERPNTRILANAATTQRRQFVFRSACNVYAGSF